MLDSCVWADIAVGYLLVVGFVAVAGEIGVPELEPRSSGG